MIKTYHYADLNPAERRGLTIRAQPKDCSAIVEKILTDIKNRGVDAVWEYAQKFDGYTHRQPFVEPKEIQHAEKEIDPHLQKSLQQAYRNIHTFHKNQKDILQETEILTNTNSANDNDNTVTNDNTITNTHGAVKDKGKESNKNEGNLLGFRYQPIDRAAAYIPGGTALYPSTILMAGVPAQIAGVPEMMLITSTDTNGQVHPVLRYCAKLVGIDRILQIGGVQGVASAVYGLFAPAIDALMGPGNSYVTCAKSLLAHTEKIKIDFPAGPSEILTIAEANANPTFIAADLLAQAEHGEDSVCVLVTPSEKLVKKVQQEMQTLLNHPRYQRRATIIKNSLRNCGFALVVADVQQAVDFSNAFAPEHLSLCLSKAEETLPHIRNAGSVFLGEQTPVALGDYFSGTNHILPTNGYARCYSGLGVETYLKRITYQRSSLEALRQAEQAILAISKTEGLDGGHGYSIIVRNDNE